MSSIPRTASGDLENPDGDQTQSSPNQQSKKTSYGDPSGPFFSLYSDAAEEEDNKMVERWQKDADGILIFTGLFSAALAAFLTVTVQDLRPNSQDTSAFYLGNIYDVLADPNGTRASTPPSVAKPPPFSAPRYAIWVNSLWFLSFVISLSCAFLATLLQQWARRYIRLTQPARRGPEKRARMRAFYADGVEKTHIPWAVEGLPTLLHLSLFLFFGGLAIFLFNVDEEVFTSVVCWIGIFLLMYGLITVLPFIRYNSPYYTPLSRPVWFLCATIPFVTFKVLTDIIYYFNFIRYGGDWVYGSRYSRLADLTIRYYDWMSMGMEMTAEEMVREKASEIDLRIFGWTISLGDDESLEKFFEAIPGLFNSKLVNDLETNFSFTLYRTFWDTLYKFVDRSLSSFSVTDEAKNRRLVVCKHIMSMTPCYFQDRGLSDLYNQAPRPIEGLQVMWRWRNIKYPKIANEARTRVVEHLPRIQERDDRWITLATNVYGLSKQDLQRNVALGGDNTLLATLIGICRRVTGHQEVSPDAVNGLRALAKIDIRHTLPVLQHEFCAVWNELVEQSGIKAYLDPPPDIIHRNHLDDILHLYILLHDDSSFYSFCNIASHRPDSTPHVPVSDSHAVRQQVKEERITAGLYSPSDPTTPGKIRDSSHAPATTKPTKPVHTASQDTDAPKGTSQVPMLSYTLRGTAQIAAAGVASSSNPLLPASSVVNFFITAVPPPYHVQPLPGADSLAIFNSTSPSDPPGNATLTHPRARGLVNTGGMCFANAVLQLLVHSPPFWDLFRELDDLKDRHGEGPETPLTGATIKFFKEFMFKEKKLPPTQRPPRQATRGKPGDGEEETRENKTMDSFDPAYIYDAMKEKKQFKDLLDGKHEDAAELLSLYLDALEEELVKLQPHISTQEPASAPNVEVLKEKARSAEGQTEVGKRDYMVASSVESPISRIFGGRSRKTVRVPNQSDTVTIEPWQSLQLDIQPDSVHTIEDALARLSQPRSMQVVQSSSNEATQEVLLKTLPQILVLHLERFMYDVATDSVNRIGKPVQFGPELEIPLEIMVPAAGKSTKPMRYKLYGVLYHHGKSAASGHYTVDIIHQNGDSSDVEGWLHIDDESVSTVRHEDVFGGQENEWVDDRCVYMLFYCRITPAQV